MSKESEQDYANTHSIALARAIEVVGELSSDRGSKTAATSLDVSLFGAQLLEI